METSQSARSRPLRAAVIKKQGEIAAAAAAAAAAHAAAPIRGGRAGRGIVPGSPDFIVQVLMKLPGFAWEEDQVW